ncbi:MAG: 5,10-Methylene-tetrahydrofolate dehydrogenase [Pseudomonadota bacterium]|jgi:methylenetetrahydrofolate dehydrogenase (NADP+)/methenyltetrahydrofolate cyclohydrolase
MTKIISGNELAKTIRSQISQNVQLRTNQGKQTTLAVILVGQDPASHVYVNNKVKACQECGINSILERYEADITQEQLLNRIQALNEGANVHGILVQLPLPKHIDSHAVIEAISPYKDVDGFHVANAGSLMTGQPIFKPCTPYACMKMLESINYDIKGAHAVVVGASNIVGKPMALLLLQAGATVTICNSKTKDLSAHTKMADIVVMAVGKPNLLKAEHIKEGAVILDVGINRLENGKLCGDADFDDLQNKASYITPVPGGVGPMTITMLLQNTLEATAYLDI